MKQDEDVSVDIYVACLRKYGFVCLRLLATHGQYSRGRKYGGNVTLKLAAATMHISRATQDTTTTTTTTHSGALKCSDKWPERQTNNAETIEAIDIYKYRDMSR